MHFKKRVLTQRPKAVLTFFTNTYGNRLYAVVDGTDLLDDHGHSNRGPAGAWRDAYYFLIRHRHADLSAQKATA